MDRPIHFIVTEFNKFIDMVSDSNDAANFQETTTPQVYQREYSKEYQRKYSQLSENSAKIHLPFPMTYLCQAGFPS